MNTYLNQPRMACYHYVAYQGLLNCEAGRKILEQAVTVKGAGEFSVKFRPRRSEPWECAVSSQEIDWYWSALEREPDQSLPSWAPALEVGYNKYLASHPMGHYTIRGCSTPGGFLYVHTIGGETGEFLSSLAPVPRYKWFLPSQKPVDPERGESPPEYDLPWLIERLGWVRQQQDLILCVGTRMTIPENAYGIVSEHAYWLKEIADQHVVIVDLRKGMQREISVPFADLAPLLWYMDGAGVAS